MRHCTIYKKNGYESRGGFKDDFNELIQFSFFILDFVGARKSLVMLTCVVNKPSSIPTIGTIIKQVKFKHKNVFVNMIAQINYI